MCASNVYLYGGEGGRDYLGPILRTAAFPGHDGFRTAYDITGSELMDARMDDSIKVLLIDERGEAAKVADFFEGRGMVASVARDSKEALRSLSRDPDQVAFVSTELRDLPGLNLVEIIIERHPQTPVIAVMPQPDLAIIIAALKRGALDVIAGPAPPAEYISKVTHLRPGDTRTVLQPQYSQATGPTFRLGQLVYCSDKMSEICQFTMDVAKTRSTVLVCGESGVGKELVAEAIHEHSPRAGAPMIKLNCAALAETLLESELFGHVRGAFTGAIANKQGRFEKAHMGTLFLDEVGDISPALQAKLLRAVQEGEFERVGSTETRKVDVRIIAATNRNLLKAVEEGTFRKDLYYRLAVIPLTIPPLRQRTDDIAVLATLFTRRYGEMANKKITGLSPKALQLLTDYAWPGNVRELENVIEWAVITCKGDTITQRELPEHVRHAVLLLEPDTPQIDKPLHSIVADFEKALLRRALDRAHWNKSLAARTLGIHRTTLLSKMEKYNL